MKYAKGGVIFNPDSPVPPEEPGTLIVPMEMLRRRLIVDKSKLTEEELVLYKALITKSTVALYEPSLLAEWKYLIRKTWNKFIGK